MKKITKVAVIFFFVSAVLGLLAVQSKSNTSDSSSDKSTEETKEKKALQVGITQVAHRTLHTYLESTATLRANRQVDLVSKTSGQIVSLNVEEGQAVEEGQELIELDPRAAQLRFQQSEIALKKADNEFRRAKVMAEKALITEEAFEAKKFEREKCQADFDQAEYDLSQTKVRAPFPGIISGRWCELGQTISTADRLFSLVQLNDLKAEVFLPEHQAATVRQEQEVILARDNGFEQVIQGRIERVAPVVDEATGTVKITVRVSPEDQQWRPGSYVHLRIITSVLQDTLTLPKKAILFDHLQNSSVFVVKEEKEGTIAKRAMVTIGSEENGFVQILEGLNADDKVVLIGKEGLKDGDPIDIDVTG
jgi:membrane fusion protein (multidrug efflux system)